MKDVHGDGRIDVFCRLIEMPFSQVVWFDSSRKQVWMRSDFPQVRATRAACQSSTSTAMAGMRVSSSGTLPSPVGPMFAPYGFCRMARCDDLVSNGGKQISMTT